MSAAVADAGYVIGFASGVITISDRVSRWRADHDGSEGRERRARPLSSVWTVDRVRITAMVLGVAAYVIIQGVTQNGSHDRSIGPVLLTSLAGTTALIVGAWYGPWAGLFTGAVGYAATVVLVLPHVGDLPFPPAYSVGDGIIGITGGLIGAFCASARPKPEGRTLAVAAVMAAIGVIIGDLAASGLARHEGIALSGSVFGQGLRSDLICAVILLPIAVIRRPRTSIGASISAAPPPE